MAVDDRAISYTGNIITIMVLANDIYHDLSSVSVQKFPQYGSLLVVGIGIFDYTPFLPHPGMDSFTYQICDSAGQCDTATVTITVGQQLSHVQSLMTDNKSRKRACV